jgi:hypothetical protein
MSLAHGRQWRAFAFDGMPAKQATYCSWGPREPSSSAGLCSSVQSTPRNLTSRRLSERSERSERSELGAAANPEQRRAVAPWATGERGRLSFGDFSLAKQRKVTRLSGRNPDAASPSEQAQAKANPPQNRSPHTASRKSPN